MKIHSWGSVLIAASLGVSGPLHAEPEATVAPARKSGIGLAMMPPNAGNPVTESMTDDELLKKRQESNTLPGEFKPVPSKPSEYGLLEMSSILESNGNFALLPKGAILFCPESQASKYVTRPTGTYTPWMDFFTMNRNWITTREVSNQEISGEKPLPPELIESFKKANLVVIATQYGNPITVLPPVKPTISR